MNQNLKHKRTRIVIDDVRAEPYGYLLFKSMDSFISWKQKNPNTIIDCLSLDHDLDEFDKNAKTGFEIVKWLVENNQCNTIKRIQFHTDNLPKMKEMYEYLILNKNSSIIPDDIKIIKEKMNLFDGRMKYAGYTFV